MTMKVRSTNLYFTLIERNISVVMMITVVVIMSTVSENAPMMILVMDVTSKNAMTTIPRIANLQEWTLIRILIVIVLELQE